MIEEGTEGKVVTKATPEDARRSRRDDFLNGLNLQCQDLGADVTTGNVVMKNYRCSCDIEQGNLPPPTADAVYLVYDRCFLAAVVGGGGGGGGSSGGGGGGGDDVDLGVAIGVPLGVVALLLVVAAGYNGYLSWILSPPGSVASSLVDEKTPLFVGDGAHFAI